MLGNKIISCDICILRHCAKVSMYRAKLIPTLHHIIIKAKTVMDKSQQLKSQVGKMSTLRSETCMRHLLRNDFAGTENSANGI